MPKSGKKTTSKITLLDVQSQLEDLAKKVGQLARSSGGGEAGAASRDASGLTATAKKAGSASAGKAMGPATKKRAGASGKKSGSAAAKGDTAGPKDGSGLTASLQKAKN